MLCINVVSFAVVYRHLSSKIISCSLYYGRGRGKSKFLESIELLLICIEYRKERTQKTRLHFGLKGTTPGGVSGAICHVKCFMLHNMHFYSLFQLNWTNINMFALSSANKYSTILFV